MEAASMQQQEASNGAPPNASMDIDMDIDLGPLPEPESEPIEAVSASDGYLTQSLPTLTEWSA